MLPSFVVPVMWFAGCLMQLCSAMTVDQVKKDTSSTGQCHQQIDRPSIRVENPWVHVTEKATASLRCQVCAKKPFVVWWSRHGEPVKSSSRVLEISLNQDQETSLRFRDVRKKDFGTYRCHVFINATHQELSERLELSGAPFPTRFDLPINWTETSFQLSWRANSSISAPIISYKLEFRQAPFLPDEQNNWVVVNIPASQHPDDVSPLNLDGHEDTHFQFLDQKWKKTSMDSLQEFRQSYTLRGLSRGTNYEVRLRSRNAFGWSHPSEVLHFRTMDFRRSIPTMLATSTEMNPVMTDSPARDVDVQHELMALNDRVQERETPSHSEPLSTRRNSEFVGYSSFNKGHSLSSAFAPPILVSAILAWLLLCP